MVATGSTNSQMTREELIALAPEVLVVVDRSGSMGGHWNKMAESVEAFAGIARNYDPNGISVILFNDSAQFMDQVPEDKVRSIFAENEPNGGTNMQAAFNKIQEVVSANVAAGKSTLVLFFGDGEPTPNAESQKKAIAQIIIAMTQSMTNDNQLAISLNQVGEDAAAAKFFQALDDELQGLGAKFDVVNRSSWTEWKDASPTAVMLAAYND